MSVTRPTDLALYGRLLRHARPYWAYIAGLFLLSLLASPLALLAPLPLKIAVDSIVSSHLIPGLLGKVLPKGLTTHSIAVLALVAGLFVAIALLIQLQELGTSLLHTYSGEKLVMTFRAQLFQHVTVALGREMCSTASRDAVPYQKEKCLDSRVQAGETDDPDAITNPLGHDCWREVIP